MDSKCWIFAHLNRREHSKWAQLYLTQNFWILGLLYQAKLHMIKNKLINKASFWIPEVKVQVQGLKLNKCRLSNCKNISPLFIQWTYTHVLIVTLFYCPHFFPSSFLCIWTNKRNCNRKSLGESKMFLNGPRRSPGLGINSSFSAHVILTVLLFSVLQRDR